MSRKIYIIATVIVGLVIVVVLISGNSAPSGSDAEMISTSTSAVATTTR